MNKVTDSRGREININDVVLYGYGFWSEPKAGIVTKINKNGFNYTYSQKNNITGGWYNCPGICKKPLTAVVVNPMAKSKEFKDLFGLDEIGLKYNTEFQNESNKDTGSSILDKINWNT